MTTKRRNVFFWAGKSLRAWRLACTLGLSVIATPAAAAIGVDVNVSTNGVSRTTTITSPTFSTSAPNQLLLAFVATDRQNATVRSVSGGDVTWELVSRASLRGSAEIWRAWATTSVNNVNVTATLATPSVAMLTVISFTGVETSGINGAGAIGASAVRTGESSLPAATLITTRADSWVIGVAADADLSAPRIVGFGQELVNQHLSSSGGTLWVQRRNTTTPTAGTAVTLNTTSPTSRRWQMVIAEIVVAAAPPTTTTYDISGSISPAAAGPGATVRLEGSSAVTTADALGNYTFRGVANGGYTVTPTKTGFLFSPATQAVTVAGANVSGVNFTATSLTYSVSGTITPATAGSGAVVTLSNGRTTTADATGNYSFASVANGSYTVTPAKSGFLFNPANQSVTVNGIDVENVNFTATTTSDPRAVTGEWSAPFDVGIVAVNMVMLHTGKVLMFSGAFSGQSFVERLWDPATGAITLVANPFYNLFCSAATQLADGRVLVAGGYDPASLGARNANIFDPITEMWSAVPNMAFRRWYPGVTALPDGRALITSGGQSCLTCLAELPEIYDPVTNRFTTLTTARLAMPFYPFPFVIPDGRIVNAGATENVFRTSALDLTTNLWTTVDANVKDGHSAAMYLPGRIIKTGTAADSGTAGSALPTAFAIDMTASAPSWRQVASMAFPRAFHNTTLLPDGAVLVTGGTRGLDGYDGSLGVRQAEMWSPIVETWQTLAAAAIPRLYHSTALLLPDGRVLTAGSGMDGPGINQRRAEIFSPPYLFKGPRPVISRAPAQAQYGTTFRVETPDATRIAKVSLIRAGAATHAMDYSQRFVPLAFSADSTALVIDAPANANIAPPGYYMLFIVNDVGVPSVASWVSLPPPGADLEPPSAPTSVIADGAIGRASLTWTAATDNTGVTLYNVHRSPISGFAPETQNRVTQTTTTSFTDVSVLAGTYYYRVTAQDVAGNVSAASDEASAVVLADVTAPTVTLTSPSDGALIAGSITVSATAGDDVGVQSVQFTLDGAPLGTAVTVPPYSTTWVSGTTSNGIHAVGAIARDAAGNVAESTVSVTVSNTAQTPNGLVAAYGFNEPAGSAQVVDASGQGNEGIISGAIRTSIGKFGGALSFDGTSSWVTVADAPSLDLTEGITVSAWVNATARTSWRTVALKETSGGLAYALYATNDALKPAGYINVSEDTDVTAPSDLLLNVWTHLAFTYDGSVMRLYVNGAEVSTTAMSGPVTVSNGPLRIGGNSVWAEFFRGIIDEVRIYNRALSGVEIGTDMITPIP